METVTTKEGVVLPYPARIVTMLGTFNFEPDWEAVPEEGIAGFWTWYSFRLGYLPLPSVWVLYRGIDLQPGLSASPDECVAEYCRRHGDAGKFARELTQRLNRLVIGEDKQEARRLLKELFELTVKAAELKDTSLVRRATGLDLGYLGLLNGLLHDGDEFVAACYDLQGDLTQFALVKKKDVLLVTEPPSEEPSASDKSPDAQ